MRCAAGPRASLLLILGLAAGCGQTGSLYLPEPPATTEDQAAEPAEDDAGEREPRTDDER